jgi:hypothetical protein
MKFERNDIKKNYIYTFLNFHWLKVDANMIMNKLFFHILIIDNFKALTLLSSL